MNLQSINVLAELERAGVEVEYSGENELKVICPFHEDRKPSCNINIEKRVFKCQTAGCEASGDIITFLAKILQSTRRVILADLQKRYNFETAKIINPKTIERYHEAIWKAFPFIEQLAARGIDETLIREYRLGFDRGRITIPIYNAYGQCVNVRKYLPGAPGPEKMRNVQGHGACRLFPFEQLKFSSIVICGGEIKAILVASLLNDRDIGAITATAGEGNWEQEFTELFKAKTVYVCFDVDKEGNVAADRLCARVSGVAQWIGKVVLPLDIDTYPHGDINDWVGQENANADDVFKLLESTSVWVKPVSLHENNGEVLELRLTDSVKAEYAAKRIMVKATVTTVDTSPYLVPKEVDILCDRNQNGCALCPIFELQPDARGIHAAVLHPESPAILTMIASSKRVQRDALIEGLGIPFCRVVEFKAQTFYGVQDARLSPQLEITSRASDHLLQPSFCVGHNLELNEGYELTGRMLPHPLTQQSTLLVSKHKPVEDALSTYQPSVEMLKQLKIFQGGLIKLKDLYADLEANVTRIFKRFDMHLMIDLVYHSVMLLPFDGRIEKGWVEGLIIGDSSQGKTEATTRMMQHYGLGERMVCKNATVAGLLGGLQQVNKRWFATWGVIPTHDKRLVILEELKGISPEVFAKLTDMRSSGVAEIPKIEKRRTHARTRLLAISNPRSDQPISAYNFGVEAIKELIGGLEDVRRFDIAVVVSSDNIDVATLNRLTTSRPSIQHRYTRDLCRRLVLWAWTRTEDQVKFTDTAYVTVLSRATELCNRFNETIPIVDRGSMRLKLARLSAALAARVFSTEDLQTLIVRKTHVDYIARFLTRMYSSTTFGYAAFSDSLSASYALRDPKLIETKLKQTPFPSDLIMHMLNTNEIELQDIQDWCGWDRGSASQLLSLLVRKNAIRRCGRSYVKQPEFIELLKSAKVQDRPDFVEEIDEF